MRVHRAPRSKETKVKVTVKLRKERGEKYIHWGAAPFCRGGKSKNSASGAPRRQGKKKPKRTEKGGGVKQCRTMKWPFVR